MSYSEHNGEILLRMSKDDYEKLFLPAMQLVTSELLRRSWTGELREMLEFTNRLNAGNPRYAPYKIRKQESGQLSSAPRSGREYGTGST